MAYVRLADGSLFSGIEDADVAKAVAAYANKNAASGGLDFSKITISPEVTKIVEKVPVQVDKVIERAVQVPVLPERPLTSEEIALIRDLRKQASIDNRNSGLVALGFLCAAAVGVGVLVYINNRSK
jgi:hypothetical protein